MFNKLNLVDSNFFRSLQVDKIYLERSMYSGKKLKLKFKNTNFNFL